ncbi:MAG: hypothetical protein H0U10_02550, partial [Chloroflexia bacterium]|nr:hypothetical protein [Chloroflexia bacterium]
MNERDQIVDRLAAAGLNRRTLLQSVGGGVGLLALGGRAAGAQDESNQLIVGSNFVIQSLDPGRSIETTTNMINHAAYDALVTFEGEDLTTPLPHLATEWTISDDG